MFTERHSFSRLLLDRNASWDGFLFFFISFPFEYHRIEESYFFPWYLGHEFSHFITGWNLLAYSIIFKVDVSSISAPK